MPTEAEAGLAPVPGAEGGGRWEGSGTLIRVTKLDPDVKRELKDVQHLKQTIAEVYYRYIFAHPTLADVPPPPEESRADTTRSAQAEAMRGAAAKRLGVGAAASGSGASGSNKAARTGDVTDEVCRRSERPPMRAPLPGLPLQADRAAISFLSIFTHFVPPGLLRCRAAGAPHTQQPGRRAPAAAHRARCQNFRQR